MDFDPHGLLAPLEPTYGREILAIVDECRSAELDIPRERYLAGPHKRLIMKEQSGIRDVVKPWKPRKRCPRMVLGDDVGLDAVAKLSMAALVGKFSYWSCSSRDVVSFV